MVWPTVFCFFVFCIPCVTHNLYFWPCINHKFWPLRAHSESLDAIFHSTKLKALASFQDLYVGLEPHKNEKELFGGVFKKTAPTVFGLLSALELHPTNKYAGGKDEILSFA